MSLPPRPLCIYEYNFLQDLKEKGDTFAFSITFSSFDPVCDKRIINIIREIAAFSKELVPFLDISDGYKGTSTHLLPRDRQPVVALLQEL